MSSYYEKILATGEVKCIDEEVPFEIPQGWEWCRLRDVIQLLSGRDLEPSMYNSSPKGIPYITGASNFNNENLIVNRWTQTPVTVSEEGDLLITCKGTIGTMAFNNIGSIHIARQIMAIHSKDVDLHYLKLYFELNIGTLESQANSMIPGISREVVLNSLVPIPPLQEQIKIVGKSNSLMPLVSKYSFAQGKLNLLNNVIKNKLEKTILQEAIKGKLVPQLAEEGTAQELLEQIKTEKQELVKAGKLKKSSLNDSVIFRGDDNKYYTINKKERISVDDEIPFDIPNTWEWCRLGTLFSHCTGKALNASNQKGELMTYITTSNLYWDRFELDNLKQMRFTDEEIEKCTATFGDLLVCEGGDIGRAAIWNYQYDIRIQNHIHKLRAYKQLCTKFFFWVFYFYKATGRIGGKGIGIQGLSSKALDKILIPLPPLKEQQRIVAQIEKLFEQLH